MLTGRATIGRVKRLAKRGATPSMNILYLPANVANGETVTINGTVFEFSTDGTPSGSNVLVDVTAAQTPTAAGTALETAINAQNTGLRAVKISANEVLVYAAAGNATAYACTETLAGSGNVWAAATCFGGQTEPTDIQVPVIISRVPTATEITLQTMHFPLNFNPTIAIPQIRTSAGAIKAWDGAITMTGNRVTLASSGTTDIASGDVITIVAF